MKRGIFAAFLCLVCVSTSWGEDLIEKDDRVLDINEIVVHYRDPNIRPPVIDKESMEKKGRIVLNLRSDGSVRGKDMQVLETDEAIKKYITKSKDEFMTAGKEPVLDLNGVTNPKFNTSRRVITIAIDVGINRVIYAVEIGGELKAEADKVADEK